MAKIKLMIAVVFLCTPLLAEEPVRWSLQSELGTYRFKERLKIQLTAEIKAGWAIYSLFQTPQIPANLNTQIQWQVHGLNKASPLMESLPQSEPDPLSDQLIFKHYQTALFAQDWEITSSLLGQQRGFLQVFYVACTQTICLPPKTYSQHFDYLIEAGAARPDYQTPTSTEHLNHSYWQIHPLKSLLGSALLMGLLAILTPCFLATTPLILAAGKYSANRWQRLANATGVWLGLALIYNSLGLLLSFFLQIQHLLLFTQAWWANLTVGLLLVFFALNILGLAQFQISSRYLTKIDNLASRYQGFLQHGLLGILLGFSSLVCSLPFLGSLLVIASFGDWQRPLIGMTIFSFSQATPFFVIALAPKLNFKIKNPAWWRVVRWLFAMLLLGFAVKFLLAAAFSTGLFEFDKNNTRNIWILAYLLWLSLPILALCLAFRHGFSLVKTAGLVLCVATFINFASGWNSRSLGPWVDSFLPQRQVDDHLNWHFQFAKAKTASIFNQKPLFLDFTGENCLNCRWVEANIFTDSKVQQRLEQFTLVRLYTDSSPEQLENQQRQIAMFQTVALPFYAVITADGRVLKQQAGIFLNPTDALNFLRLETDSNDLKQPMAFSF